MGVMLPWGRSVMQQRTAVTLEEMDMVDSQRSLRTAGLCTSKEAMGLGMPDLVAMQLCHSRLIPVRVSVSATEVMAADQAGAETQRHEALVVKPRHSVGSLWMLEQDVLLRKH